MSEPSCDMNDVANAASDLVTLGCSMGAMNLHDGRAQLQFSASVAHYVNGIISDVSDGVISAWDGVQQMMAEYTELSSEALFYAQNGIGVAAGAMQVEVGFAFTGASYGVAAPVGALFVVHGVNNIYEGAANIYNGPAATPAQGPIRSAYQSFLGDDYDENVAYGTIDLLLSAGGMMRLIRKTDSVQLFRHDPLNYQSAYQGAGKLALLFEALVDSITVNSILSEERNRAQHQ
ncbi:hypothetical protein AO240_24800 [Pseudomonas sp. ICMP 460]|nr:hypothetical protein AO240_24800 [Pseudomonas sp. ICMP 460]